MEDINEFSDHLFKKYGRCKIPKGTFLYRGHSLKEPIDTIYFGTKPIYIIGFGDKENIQIWKAKTDIEVIFLVKYLNSDGFAKSSLPDLYYDLYPNEPNKNFRDLDIKQNKRKIEFVKYLQEKSCLKGWVSSIEENFPIELCLFVNDKLTQLIELVEVKKYSEGLCDDSLKKFKIVLNESFKKRSEKEFGKFESPYSKKKNYYKEYLKKRLRQLKDCIEEGGTKEECLDNRYNLRLRLKI
jgi:hypothetical protein